MFAFPLNNTEYEAKALGAWFGIRTRGVLSAEANLAVSPGGGMTVNLSTGIAWLKQSDIWGVVQVIEAPQNLTVPAASSGLNRIDAVCVRLNKITNSPEIVIIAGNPATTALPPTPTRDIYYDEIFVAYVTVNAGTTEITSSMIQDTRLIEDICGIVRDGVNGIPSDQLWQQFESELQVFVDEGDTELENLRQAIANIIAGSETMLKLEYDPNSKGIDITTQEYIHTALAVLAGVGANGYFKSAFSGTVSSINIDGTAYTVKNGEETEIELISGVVYSFILIDNTINFAGSGSGSALTLLWQNASPTSQFLPQTITINGLGNYDYIDVVVRASATGGLTIRFTDTVPSFGLVTSGSLYNMGIPYAVRSTTFNFATGNIQFSNGYADPGTIRNDLVVPLQIYGGKL